MLFNSYTFIIFFAVVLFLHHLPLRWSVRKFNLLVASYLFYAAWNPPFVILLWLSTIIDWIAGKHIYRARTQGMRSAFLGLSLATNLGLLGFFKYGEFALENFLAALAAFGIHFQPAVPDIVLPVGISFYTFQTLSYTFDIYRKRTAPCGSFLDYALFVTFFPQLVAGPIVRSVDFLPQCEEPRQASGRQMNWGLSLFVLGLFEKVVVADGLLAPLSDRVYANTTQVGFLDGWCAAAGFMGQVFCDFAGYSSCAIGAALCLGFAINDNFRFPYGAIGFADFWRRWHISLSTWLRDYVYFSMGGSRYGGFRTFLNAMATMLLVGLWHGAAWTYVFFGGVHGFLLSVERISQRAVGSLSIWKTRPGRVFLWLLTMFILCITMMFFRAQSFGDIGRLSLSMIGLGNGFSPHVLRLTEVVLIAGVMVVMLGIHWLMRDTTVETVADRLPWWLRSMALAGMLGAIATMAGDTHAFIYFQF